jgi:hypothetical protein
MRGRFPCISSPAESPKNAKQTQSSLLSLLALSLFFFYAILSSRLYYSCTPGWLSKLCALCLRTNVYEEWAMCLITRKIIVLVLTEISYSSWLQTGFTSDALSEAVAPPALVWKKTCVSAVASESPARSATSCRAHNKISRQKLETSSTKVWCTIGSRWKCQSSYAIYIYFATFAVERVQHVVRFMCNSFLLYVHKVTWQRSKTLIEFARKSKYRNRVSPSSPSTFAMRFWERSSRSNMQQLDKPWRDTIWLRAKLRRHDKSRFKKDRFYALQRNLGI